MNIYDDNIYKILSNRKIDNNFNISEKILFKIIYSKIIYLNNKIINDIKDKNHQS